MNPKTAAAVVSPARFVAETAVQTDPDSFQKKAEQTGSAKQYPPHSTAFLHKT